MYHPDKLKISQRKDVISALHAAAKSESWVECLGRVGMEMNDRLSASSITLLPSVIERIPVLLFAGDQDFICNYMGIESMIKSMTWNGEKGLGVSLSSSTQFLLHLAVSYSAARRLANYWSFSGRR